MPNNWRPNSRSTRILSISITPPSRPGQRVTAVQTFAQENCQRGAAGYKQWLARDAELRQQLGDLINAPSVDDIALVKNTSEALSMVAGGLDWRYGENVVSSNEEFPSNRIVWEAQKRFGVEFREVDLQAVADPDADVCLRRAYPGTAVQ